MEYALGATGDRGSRALSVRIDCAMGASGDCGSRALFVERSMPWEPQVTVKAGTCLLRLTIP